MSTFCTGRFYLTLSSGVGQQCGWMLASSPEVADRAIGPSRSCCHTSSHNWSSAGVKRWPSATQSEPPSATLDILFDDHAAVSEERAGQWLQECPSVGARVKCLHVAEGWTLAAHDASRGVDLPVQNDGTAWRDKVFFRSRNWMQEKWHFSKFEHNIKSY